MVIGPLLQPSLNTSSEIILKLIDGSKDSYPHAYMMFVDVRDVAISHVKVFENQNATGRFLCVSCAVTYKQVCDSLRKTVKQRKINGVSIPECVKGFPPNEGPTCIPNGFYKFSNAKLKSLGVSFRNIDEMVDSTVVSLIDKKLFLPSENVQSSL